ncbi:hypothetical protein HYH03_012937 [Edaphochlamys debaryana]|uniref:CBS domain-containing protein n=1 Tax=Edaphochlamys debaryana TaxID=47281 RepID=A0A835XRN8_9CHLO|nr:hypothetical protein HYH03_012937 [Edaphochlamys debaryana]|eukprot:KAG2488430.1 hypothetical protein HYH03_012937 [Edaphochlamys debaryana]
MLACGASSRASTASCVRRAPIAAPRFASLRVRASEPGASSPPDMGCVRDVMTHLPLFTASPDMSVDTALELLVEHRITGLPVVDLQNRVVGVVSDFDLLALDAVGRVNSDQNLFPAAEQSWQAFKEVKRIVAKSVGKKIKDVMTPDPFTVRPETNLNDATAILITKKIRRLPVVNADGKLVGILSRGNIVKAALAARKATAASNNGAS